MNASVREAEAQIGQYYLAPSIYGQGIPPYVEGTIFSKGRGLGSIFRSIARSVTPFIKSAARKIAPIAKKTGKYMLKQGLNMAADTASDMLQGSSAVEALTNNTAAALENMRYDGLRKVENLRPRKTKGSKLKRSKKRRKRPPLDNFD